MANSFINSTLLSQKAAAHFRLNNTFYATSNHMYDSMFTDKTYDPGDTVNIRLRNFGRVQRGNTVSAVDIVETSLPLQLQQLYSYPVTYTTDDLSTKLRANTWMERVFLPGVDALVAEINKDIAANAALVTYNWTGTVGTQINSFATVSLIDAYMTEMAIPMANRSLTMTPANSAALKNSLTPILNTVVLNQEVNKQNVVGRLSNFNLYQDQLIATHTAYSGAIGTPLVNGAVSSGSTIDVDGLTNSITGIFKAGDVIEIDGVYKVDPISKSNTGRKMQFVITADADSNGSGEATISVSPTIISSTTNPNQNVSNAIPDNAAITRPATHKANIAYTDESLFFVTPPLAPLDSPFSSTYVDKEAGVSIRVSKSSEILNNKNVMRLDVLCGYLWIPTHTWRVIT